MNDSTPIENYEPKLSRAMRRAHEKLEKQANRKGKRQPREKLNTIATAIRRSEVMSYDEAAKWMSGINGSFDMLRKGECTPHEFDILAEVMNIGMQLTNPGFNIASDHKDTFSKAMDALAALGRRVTEGRGWTCYAQELKDIEFAIEIHCIQIQFASRAEMYKAQQAVIRRHKGADSGSLSKSAVSIVIDLDKDLKRHELHV